MDLLTVLFILFYFICNQTIRPTVLQANNSVAIESNENYTLHVCDVGLQVSFIGPFWPNLDFMFMLVT